MTSKDADLGTASVVKNGERRLRVGIVGVEEDDVELVRALSVRSECGPGRITGVS